MKVIFWFSYVIGFVMGGFLSLIDRFMSTAEEGIDDGLDKARSLIQRKSKW